MKKNGMKMVAILTVLVLAVSLVGCGTFGVADAKGNEADMGGSVVSNSSGEAPATSEATPEEERKELPTDDVRYDENADMGMVSFNGKNYEPKTNVTNILLLGVDSDAERVKTDAGWRSDMIMLVSIDNDTNQITCTSVPRDTRAFVSHVNESGQVTSEVEEKINHAYAYGGGPSKYSAENAMSAVEKLLECGGLINVPIDYYISIDLDGLPKIADALDGVPVTLEQSVPDVGKKGETVDLNGAKVRKYLENRHDMDDGEFSRQRHEQEFVRAMARKIKELGAKEAAPGLYDTFMKFMRTNMSLDNVLSVATILDNANMDEMKFNLMENGSPEVIGGTWYYRASQDEILHQMLDALYKEV